MLHFEAVTHHADTSLLEAHRDDHYIFILQESGRNQFMLDFEMLDVSGAAVLYVMPGQVHHGVLSENTDGYFLAIDTLLVSEEYREVFEQQIRINAPVPLAEHQKNRLKRSLELLYDKYQDMDTILGKSIAYALASAFIGTVAEIYLEQRPTALKQASRPMQLSTQFRQLLLQHYKTIKSPAVYAGMMNVSLSYLNEAVKAITGFPVSYWIQHEVVLEAKRLLYYTDLNVKQIAFALGYPDHTYFSRLFTKSAGCSAARFRSAYR